MTRTNSLRLAPLLLPLLLTSGCSDRAYHDFSAPIINSAFLLFFLGNLSIYMLPKLFQFQRVRELLKRLSFAARVTAILLAVCATVLVVYGYLSEGLYFYNSYLGTILLFIANRFHRSATFWRDEKWEDAKENSKMILFSISVFTAIAFLIYYGQNVLVF